MAKKGNAIQNLAGFISKKFEENLAKGYKGMGFVYSGLLNLCKKYSGISNTVTLVEELNKELKNYNLRIVPDRKAKMKVVRIAREDVKEELENEFQEYLRQK